MNPYFFHSSRTMHANLLIASFLLLTLSVSLKRSTTDDVQFHGHSSTHIAAFAHTQGGDIEVQITNTETEREKGLQGVPKLLPGHGILFLTDKPQIPTMWMRHVRIPLDMIFVRNGTITDVIASAPPCDDLTLICPTYSPRQKIDAVIEVGAGEAKRLGFTPGAKVNIPDIQSTQRGDSR